MASALKAGVCLLLWLRGVFAVTRPRKPKPGGSLPGIEPGARPGLCVLIYFSVSVFSSRCCQPYRKYRHMGYFWDRVGGSACQNHRGHSTSSAGVGVVFSPIPGTLVLFRAAKSFLCFPYLFLCRCQPPMSDVAVPVSLRAAAVCDFSKVNFPVTAMDNSPVYLCLPGTPGWFRALGQADLQVRIHGAGVDTALTLY